MKMPRVVIRIWMIGLLFIGISCKKTDDPVETEANNAISTKFKALGWDTQTTTASGDAVKTKGDKGYVQYYTYNGRKRAIYYYSTITVALEPDLVDKYDALGQETFTHLGLPTSDAKACGSGCTYADFESGVMIKSPAVSTPAVVYGTIYEKYVALNKWSGVLGYPTTDELDLTSKRGRYNVFKGGQIYWSSSTGAQAFWGKTEALYKATGYDTGWLGLPTTSVTPTVDFTQAAFENGSIVISSTCGFYYNKQNQQVLVNGSRGSGCY